MDCLFCSIVAGDVPSRKVHEDDQAYAFLDIELIFGLQQLMPGDPALILAGEERGDPQVLAEIAPAVSHVARLLVDRLDADGINMLSSAGPVAGQEVYHLHVHLVPRYGSDPGLAALFRKGVADDPDAVLAQLTGG